MGVSSTMTARRQARAVLECFLATNRCSSGRRRCRCGSGRPWRSLSGESIPHQSGSIERTTPCRAYSLSSRILHETVNDSSSSSRVRRRAGQRQEYRRARTCQSTCLREQLMFSCPCAGTGERRMPTATCMPNLVMILRRRENTSVDDEGARKKQNIFIN